MSGAIVLASPASVNLQPSPITPSWILSDAPEASCEVLSKSRDGASYVVVWECSAGRFNWHYSEDETVVILSGEVTILMDDGQERRLRQGDTGFFPAGSSCTWHVTQRIRKVAVLRKTLPFPVGVGLRIWHKLLRTLAPPRESMI